MLAETTALCPECLIVLDALTVERDGAVWLERTCPDHGPVSTLVLSDAAWWRWSRKFLREGRRPTHHATSTVEGCPWDCGMCPEHAQHACVTVLEITEACNLTCPACFAGEAHARHRSEADVEGMLAGLLAAEGGTADVVMLSGGEPTLHPRLLAILDRLKASPVRYVILNTNGLRIARDPSLAEELAARDVLVYLQLDGFSEETHRVLRGRPDLLEPKLEALARLTGAGVRVVVVATVIDVNLGELGELVRFAAAQPAVRAVSLQPQFGEGRHVAFDPTRRVTLTDVIDAVGTTSGIFARDDFVPVPCCDPMCTAAAYGWRTDGEVTPVTRLVPVETYLDYLTNTAMPNLSEAFASDVAEMRAVLERLWSKSSPAGSDRQLEAFLCACEPLAVELDRIGDLPGEVFAVTVEGFLDRWNFDVGRVSRCCVSEALPDGRIIPFCAYNTLYRFAPDHRPRPGSAPLPGHQPVVVGPPRPREHRR